MPALAFNPICPFGKKTVTAAGTPQRLFTDAEIALASNGRWPTRVSRIYLEALNANTGFIYIGVSTLVKATLVGVIMTLAPPSGGLITNYADFTENFAGGTNNYNLKDYWIDADTTEEGVLRTVWVW